jgi:hypothetical protein
MQNAFLSFVHAAFGDDHETLAQIQLIAGRLFLPQCNKAEQVYFHVGVNDASKTTLLYALNHVFHGVTLIDAEDDVRGNAAYLEKNNPCLALRIEPSESSVSCGEIASPPPGAKVFRTSAVVTGVASDDMYPKKVGGFVCVMLSETFIKHMSALTSTQVHVSVGAWRWGIEKIVSEAALRRICFIDWSPKGLPSERTLPQEMRTPKFAEGLAQDPDFIIWLAEGLRRAQTIDKVQPTIDRPAADIVLSDEPGE